MHHSFFCQGLSAFFSAGGGPPRGTWRTPTPTPPPSQPKGAGSSGHGLPVPDCRPARSGGPRPGRPTSDAGWPGAGPTGTQPTPLGKSLLDPVYGAQRHIQGFRHLGSRPTASLLSRIRALAVNRAELFPYPNQMLQFLPVVPSPAAPRTYHEPSPLPPPSTLHPQQYTATGQILERLSTSRLTEY